MPDATALTTIRRRTATAAAGLAALALVLGACGEEGTTEAAVGSATSAVGSAAAEATSAAGSAAAEATSAVGDATRDSGSEDGGSGDGSADGEGTGNPDEEFLNDLRRVGVDVPDDQDYLTRGREVCASLDGGTGYIDVLRQYGEAHPEAPATEAPAVVTAAVKALCSQHLPQIR